MTKFHHFVTSCCFFLFLTVAHPPSYVMGWTATFTTRMTTGRISNANAQQQLRESSRLFATNKDDDDDDDDNKERNARTDEENLRQASELATEWIQKKRNIIKANRKFNFESNDDANSSSSDLTLQTEPKTPVYNETSIAKVVSQRILKNMEQEDMDKLYNSRHGPINMISEIKNVISVDHSKHADGSVLSADEIYHKQLEADMYEACKLEDYAFASVQKSELNRASLTDVLAVLSINARYYRSFSTGDSAAMREIWIPDDTCVCIHPGTTAPLFGYNTIAKAYECLFADAQSSSTQTKIAVDNVRVSVKGATTAVVTCTEHVSCRRYVHEIQAKEDVTNTLTTTNIYHKIDASANGKARWYLAHHHAGWHAESVPTLQALGYSTKNEDDANNNAIYVNGSSMTNTKRNSISSSKTEMVSPTSSTSIHSIDEMSGPIGLEGILGTQQTGSNTIDTSNDQQQQTMSGRKIVMGSLSELLNGNIDDMFNNSNNDNGNGNNQGLPIMFSGSTGNGNNSIDKFLKNVNGGGSNVGGIQIRHTISSNDEEDDEDDDDDEEDDDDHHDENSEIDDDSSTSFEYIHPDFIKDIEKDENGDTTIQTIENWVNNDPKAASQKSTKKQSSKTATPQQRQKKIIGLLRKLHQHGTISTNHKRVLLTDMIARSSSSSSSSSKIEVAYDLLINDDDDDDSAMVEVMEEEFGDQCRILAEDILVAQEEQK